MKIFIFPRFWVTLLLVFSCSYLSAAVYTITTLAFTGPGSINEILTQANSTPGPHTINFSVAGTITATQLLPTITEDLTINADGIVIDGSFSYQIFDVASSSNTTINGVTVQNASAVVGSAISNRGTLTLNEVTLSGNRSTDRGGAIYNQGGDLTINNSTINNNQGGSGTAGGGGIYNSAAGSMDITNTTFSGNFSFAVGGAIHNVGQMDLTHVTIASNTAFATTNAGGGIHNDGSLSMYNSIAYNNTVGFFGTPEDIHNDGTVNNFTNLVGVCSGSCPPFAYSSNPLLSPLANNGGPTQTMLLLSGSPAIGTADPMWSEPTDQRGFGRDANPDLGAYEADATNVPVEFVSFKAELLEHEQIVRLSWVTASELENAGFEVQRSIDALNWEVIGFVKGAGTTTEEQHYKYDDEEANYHSNYYRLKQIDKDGSYEYSHIEEVSLDKLRSLDLVLSPNPVRSELFYQLVGDYDDDEDYQMVIFNILGVPVRDVYVLTKDICHLPMDNLPNGSYFILLKDTRNILLKRNIVIVR